MSDAHFSPDLSESTDTRIREPALYRVVLHNDDYTTMEFVVEVLQQIFHKPKAVATTIMLEVHNNGSGVCGLYPAEIAESKAELVHARAREAGFPLRCTVEQA